MSRLFICCFAAVLGVAHAAPATAIDSNVTLEEVWRVVQAQQAQIDALTKALEATETSLEATETKVAITEEQLIATADYLAPCGP